MTLRNYLILAVSLGLITISSCGGVKKPNDLPKLYPTKVSIVQDNGPVEGAIVTLIPESGRDKWSSGGVTSTQGVAEIVTHGQFSGAPARKYKVTVSKMKGEGKDTVFVLVDPKFGSDKTTPFELDVTEGVNEKTFELGAPFNQEIKPTS